MAMTPCNRLHDVHPSVSPILHAKGDHVLLLEKQTCVVADAPDDALSHVDAAVSATLLLTAAWPLACGFAAVALPSR